MCHLSATRIMQGHPCVWKSANKGPTKRYFNYTFDVKVMSKTILDQVNIEDSMKEFFKGQGVDVHLSAVKVDQIDSNLISSKSEDGLIMTLDQSLIRDNFIDVIWTDGTSLQLDPETDEYCVVRVWGGISWKGATTLCTYSGTLDDNMYIDMLKQCLLPFLKNMHPVHQFVQLINHPSVAVQKFFKENGINWWRTPPHQSPDLNPMENLWHELKV